MPLSHAGRGFAVAADEVRKLAESSHLAAQDMVQLTGRVTSRVAQSASAMETSERAQRGAERRLRADDRRLPSPLEGSTQLRQLVAGLRTG